MGKKWKLPVIVSKSDISENPTWDGLLSIVLFWNLNKVAMAQVQWENMDVEFQYLRPSFETPPFENETKDL